MKFLHLKRHRQTENIYEEEEEEGYDSRRRVRP
jgi:hypothetical protein